VGLSRPAIDALIDSGHLLCRVADGETRIPLEQLEAFFREGLLRVYRAQVENAPPPPPAVIESEVCIEPSPAVQRADVDLPLLPLLEISSEPARDDRHETSELRHMSRYVPGRHIDGIFDSVKFTIVQISRTGIRIRHTKELVPGTESRLTFALLNPARSFLMSGRVVWTSVAISAGGHEAFYISGIGITEHADRLDNVINLLQAAHDLRPDLHGRGKETPAETVPLDDICDDDITRVMDVVQHFSSDALDASRWYGRGHFALSDPEVRRTAPHKPRDREEVLGIWEYLERQIDIPKIAEIISRVRRSKAAIPAQPYAKPSFP
jgi:hypothetical protein